MTLSHQILSKSEQVNDYCSIDTRVQESTLDRDSIIKFTSFKALVETNKNM